MPRNRDPEPEDVAGGGLSGRPPDEPVGDHRPGEEGSDADARTEHPPTRVPPDHVDGEVVDDEGPGSRPAEPPVPLATRMGQAAVLLLAVVFGVFALVNSQPVDFSWIFGETQVRRDPGGEVVGGGIPLIVLLLVSFILGAALGGWWVQQAVKRRRRDRAERHGG